mgnify:CR=1 FL=1
MMPSPPWMRRSAQRIGQGFQISNSRNRANPTSIQRQSPPALSSATGMAATSSHTIAGWSCAPSARAVRAQSGMPSANIKAVSVRYNGSGSASMST